MQNDTENVGMFDDLKSELVKESATEEAAPIEKIEDDEINDDKDNDEQASADDKNGDDVVDDTAGKVYTDKELEAIVDKKLHKKISKMTRRDKEKSELIESQAKRLAIVEGKLAPKEVVKTLADFDDDQDKYTDYLLDKKLNARIKAANDENNKHVVEQRKLSESEQDRLDARKDSFEDLVKLVPDAGKAITAATDVFINDTTMADIDEMDNPAGIIWMMVNDPKEAKKINEASDRQRLIKLAKLDMKLETKLSNIPQTGSKITKAPVTPVGDIMRGAVTPSTTPIGGKEDQAMAKYMKNFGFQ